MRSRPRSSSPRSLSRASASQGFCRVWATRGSPRWSGTVASRSQGRGVRVVVARCARDPGHDFSARTSRRVGVAKDRQAKA
eukprot:9248276-Lingulodinium_polyedra.AAC.1